MVWSFCPLFAAMALGLAAALPQPQSALAETIKLSLVQTDDIDRLDEHGGRGGFARLASAVAAERAKGTVAPKTEGRIVME